jgi:hypothetical protein
MAYVFPPEMSRSARAHAGPPGDDGWLTTTVPIESLRHGHIELLKLGAEAEVLDPPELRALFAATARGLGRTYLRDEPDSTEPGPDGPGFRVEQSSDL